MKERILFIFLLFSISAFSQEKASMGTIKLTAIVPDSLLNMKVLHYAQELKYVDKDAQQDTYDAASFFIINSINSKDLKIDTYLFSFPSQLSYSPLGIAIKHKNDYFLYSYGYLPLAILKIMHLSQQDSSVYTSVIHSMYNLLQYASKEGIELKHELIGQTKYYYNIVNWVHVFKMKDFDYWQHSNAYCPTYNPTASLFLVKKIKNEDSEQITQWIQTSYGKDFPYKVYKVFNTKKESLYLIEVDRSYHKEYDFLFVKGENYVFYQINNSFIPIMYVLKSFFKRNNETLLKSIECLSLAWLYYQGA